MAVDPPTSMPGAPPAGGRLDSGEHAAADKSTLQIGRSRFTWRWSGVARAVVIVMSGAAVSVPALIVAIRAPSNAEVSAKVQQKAEEVLAATAQPIDNHADELARTRAELARLATIVSFYENERKTLAADPSQHTPRRKRRGAEIEKKVAAAAQDLKLITARASEPAPLSAPKTLPGDAPKEAPPQQQVPAKQQGAGGGNP